MNPCNRCLVNRLKEEAKKTGKKVVQVRSLYELGGWEIYVVAKGESPSKDNWEMWVMELSDTCCC